MRSVLYVCLLLLLMGCNDSGPARQNSQPLDYEHSLHEVSIDDLQKAYAAGDFLIEEVVKAYLARIEAIDLSGPALNSIIHLNPDALETARQLDREYREGRIRGPLHGIPLVLKDNIDTRNMPTTAGSRALEGSYPPEDAFITRLLTEAGAVILGKANLSEWANFRGELSSSGWSGLGGQTRNPYDLLRNPCGSSSGSAVAVSANLCVLAIGTETNGSIVCPAHANGIVGIKPTIGLISRQGIIPIAHSLDVAGPMARTVRDAAIALSVLSAFDPADKSTEAGKEYHALDYTLFLKPEGLKGKRLGLFTGAMGRNFKVDSLVRQAISLMELHGAEIIEIDRISAPQTAQNAFQVMLYEYRHGLNAYFASLGADAPVKSLEELIAFNRMDSLSLQHFNQHYLELAFEKGGLEETGYLEALQKMKQGAGRDGIDLIMSRHRLDAIIAPTGSPAWFTDWVNGDSFQLGSSSAAAHAGYPNITVPMGFIEGLPVGMSFFGRAFSEPVLLEIAYGFEQNTHHRKAPPH